MQPGRYVTIYLRSNRFGFVYFVYQCTKEILGKDQYQVLGTINTRVFEELLCLRFSIWLADLSLK